MITKYNAGDKVLIEAEVLKIIITDNKIEYRLKNPNWSNIEIFEESEIKARATKGAEE